jgi:hypothetical protein
VLQELVTLVDVGVRSGGGVHSTNAVAPRHCEVVDGRGAPVLGQFAPAVVVRGQGRHLEVAGQVVGRMLFQLTVGAPRQEALAPGEGLSMEHGVIPVVLGDGVNLGWSEEVYLVLLVPMVVGLDRLSKVRIQRHLPALDVEVEIRQCLA